MESAKGGMNSFYEEFSRVGAWPASVGMGGTSGAFNSCVHNPAHHANPGMTAKDVARRGLNTTSLSYVAMI